MDPLDDNKKLECMVCGSIIYCSAWTFDDYPLAYCWGVIAQHVTSEEEAEDEDKLYKKAYKNGADMPDYHPMTKMESYD